jgi:nitroreductase
MPTRKEDLMMLQQRPDCYQHVLGLRAVRRFTDEPLSDHDITAILEAGRWTGSAKNRQAWTFVVMSEPEDRARLASLGGTGGPLTHARLSIALVRLPEGNDFDIGRVAQNMMLAAAARGIGSCPATLHDPEKTAAALNLPADHVARRAIAFGYPDEAEEESIRAERRAAGRAGRKPLGELVRHGTFR